MEYMIVLQAYLSVKKNFSKRLFETMVTKSYGHLFLLCPQISRTH